MSRTDETHPRLTDAFALRVIDVAAHSERHRGPAGFQEGGESHFNVRLRAEAFKGMSRIARHRAVHAAIGVELMAKIHALSLDLGV